MALARARGALNENAGFAQDDRGRMKRFTRIQFLKLGSALLTIAHSRAAGSEMTKRAPAPCRTGLSSSSRDFSTDSGEANALSSAELPGRFSAQIRPPWASIICREIDKPRPEFWPNPWFGR